MSFYCTKHLFICRNATLGCIVILILLLLSLWTHKDNRSKVRTMASPTLLHYKDVAVIAQGGSGCAHKGSAVESALKILQPKRTHVYICSQIEAMKLKYSDKYMQQKREFDLHLKKVDNNAAIAEGHSGQREVISQYRFYNQIAQEPWVKVICETGFNAGHSAFQWLVSSANTTKLFSFDICGHPYTLPMAEYITATFPGRFSLTCGDSTKTLPLMINLIHQCDLVIVDGGHSYDVALKDLFNFQKLANRDHHLVIIDDVPAIDDVIKAWEKAKSRSVLTEIFMCKASLMRGIGVGVYSSHNT